MAKYFIIGEQGKNSVWVVDTQNRSVREVDGANTADAHFVDAANAIRRSGGGVMRGIDLAAATDVTSDAASHRFAPSV